MSMKKRYAFSLLLFICWASVSLAQSPFGKSAWEFGLHAGPTMVNGDLGAINAESILSPDNYDLNALQFMGGMHARYKFNARFALNNSFQFGFLESSDLTSDDPEALNRGLMHRTTTYQLSSCPEFYFVKDKEMMGQKSRFSAYVFSGLSLIWFNPRIRYNGELYNTHPMQLEGVDYSRLTLGVPMGLGFKVNLTRSWTVGYRLMLTYTFTDYLDDVSDRWTSEEQLQAENGEHFGLQIFRRSNATEGKIRGNPESNDMFMVHQIGLTYRFDRGEVRRSNFYHFLDFWFSKPGRKKF